MGRMHESAVSFFPWIWGLRRSIANGNKRLFGMERTAHDYGSVTIVCRPRLEILLSMIINAETQDGVFQTEARLGTQSVLRAFFIFRKSELFQAGKQLLQTVFFKRKPVIDHGEIPVVFILKGFGTDPPGREDFLLGLLETVVKAVFYQRLEDQLGH